MMPAALVPAIAGLPSHTSSEVYTQTLAAQADVLVAAQAWPLLIKSLSDLTDLPDRRQLAIITDAKITNFPSGASTQGSNLCLQRHPTSQYWYCWHLQLTCFALFLHIHIYWHVI